MVQLKRVDSEFSTPKVRDSFTNQVTFRIYSIFVFICQFVWDENVEQGRLGYSLAYANTLLSHLDGKLAEYFYSYQKYIEIGQRRMLSKFTTKKATNRQKGKILYQRHVGQSSMRSLLTTMVKLVKIINENCSIFD
jgi:hypothetical protein